MANLEPSGPNAEQIQYWNDQAGPKWAELQDPLDQQIEPLGRMAMDRAEIARGERVLDVGCGCGQTSIELGRRVGQAGAVVGIDISAVMLERARERARDAGVPQVRFDLVDAQTHSFTPAAFDVLYSRFGVMFFADPTAAFANLARALRPGARLAFVTWRALPENEWVTVPLGAALQHIPPPAMLAPDAPGPFAFADPERARRVLVGAGFADVLLEKEDTTLVLGGDRPLDEVVRFFLQIGPTAAALREAGPELADRVAAAVRDALLPYRTPEGIRLGAAIWVATARRP